MEAHFDIGSNEIGSVGMIVLRVSRNGESSIFTPRFDKTPEEVLLFFRTKVDPGLIVDYTNSSEEESRQWKFADMCVQLVLAFGDDKPVQFRGVVYQFEHGYNGLMALLNQENPNVFLEEDSKGNLVLKE